MKGIRLSHGVVFVSDGEYTVRLLPTGECGISPIVYEALEWDLRTDPPEHWEYLTDQEIRTLPDDGFKKIVAALKNIHSVLDD